jgi:hypothetical protein
MKLTFHLTTTPRFYWQNPKRNGGNVHIQNQFATGNRLKKHPAIGNHARNLQTKNLLLLLPANWNHRNASYRLRLKSGTVKSNTSHGSPQLLALPYQNHALPRFGMVRSKTILSLQKHVHHAQPKYGMGKYNVHHREHGIRDYLHETIQKTSGGRE